MELYKEILIKLLEKEDVHITFPNLNSSPEKLIERRCYAALRKIKAIIQDDNLEDKECFQKIEEIVCLFEKLGSDGGNRHDFG